MHADEIKNRIEREQKLINTEYLEDTKKAKRMI